MKCSTSNQIKILIWFQLTLFHFILWYLHSKLRKLGLVFFMAWQQKQSSSDVEVYLNLIQRTAQHLNYGTKFLCKHMGLDIFSRQQSPHLSGSTLWKCIMCFLNISMWVGLGGWPFSTYSGTPTSAICDLTIQWGLRAIHWNQDGRREQSGPWKGFNRLGLEIYHSRPNSTGQDSVTWPHPSARKAGEM